METSNKLADYLVYITIKPMKLRALKKRLRLKLRKYSMRHLDLSVYYCLKCKRIHKKMIKGESVASKTFFNHWNYREHNRKLSNSELFKIDFIKKWKQEGKKENGI